MRILACALIAAAAVSCTRRNPDACCNNEQQCSANGFDGITGCDTGKVCNPDGVCVATQCSTSADCTSPGLPLCVGQLCVATCTADMDCDGIAGKPHCASDGACVACTDDTQCTSANEPVCDATTSACRACAADTDCASGVCLAANGTCANADDVQFVARSGIDTGTCPKLNPCATIPYALGQGSGADRVIHISGGTYEVTSQITLDTFSGTFAGGDTVVSSGGSGSSGFYVTDGVVTFSSMTLDSITVSGGKATLYAVDLTGVGMANGGTLVADHSTIDGNFGVEQSANGSVLSSTVHGIVQCRDGVMDIERTLFDNADLVSLLGATATIINNVFVTTATVTPILGFNDSSNADVEFNTIVNLSGTAAAAAPFNCEAAAVIVRNNVFAWDATVASDCAITYSLFDGSAAMSAGSGNIVGNASTFFADEGNKDFHLGSASPAIGAGDPASTVTTDYDGNPRPNPAGSRPDIGAFESPQ